MAIISQDFLDEQYRNKSILQFAKENNIAALLKKSNIHKARGIGVLTVFIQLLSVAFSGKSLNMLLDSGNFAGKKDVFYRFINSTTANWLKFIRLLSNNFIARLNSFFSDDTGVLIAVKTLSCSLLSATTMTASIIEVFVA